MTTWSTPHQGRSPACSSVERLPPVPEAGIFLDKLTDLLRFLIPNYIKEGKYRLVIAIGCTGGKHRSVTLANKLYERMKAEGHYGIKLYHRDVPREGI